MSQAKHTPGPWVMYQTPNDPDFVAEIEGIASVYAASGDALANARIIAAAPELLEAAKLVIAWYEAEDDHSKADFYQRMDMCRASEAALRSAISKATGEAQ